jgi:thymidylate synthase ThyX
LAFKLEEFYEKNKEAIQSCPVKVTLIGHTEQPYDTAIASARTCYSSKGILYPTDMTKNEAAVNLRDRIAKSTLRAGHLTTRQHSHYIFAIEGLSRYTIWQFLHAHPYYNSEQVSQRYVPIKKGENWYSLPQSLKNDKILNWINECHQSYLELIDLLKPTVSEEFFKIHKLKARAPEKYQKDIEKRAMEVARYLMPLATTAYLYHTISSLTLYRYIKMAEYYDNYEIKALVFALAQCVVNVDPLMEREFPEPAKPDWQTPDPKSANAFNQEFDAELGAYNSKLVKYDTDYTRILDYGQGTAGPNSFHYLNTEKNHLLGDTLYPVTMQPQGRMLHHLHYTFLKKLSHTADSQEQRHRTLPGSRPLLFHQISLENDYIIPELLKLNPKAMEYYKSFMDQNYSLVRNLFKEGHKLEDLTYLLPNAFPVRFLESGDLLNFYHKWKARLCYNAQEEIFYSAKDEVLQVRKVQPEIGLQVGPPCYLRNALKPRCPEGDHFCGIKVWQLPLDQYERTI